MALSNFPWGVEVNNRRVGYTGRCTTFSTEIKLEVSGCSCKSALLLGRNARAGEARDLGWLIEHLGAPTAAPKSNFNRGLSSASFHRRVSMLLPFSARSAVWLGNSTVGVPISARNVNSHFSILNTCSSTNSFIVSMAFWGGRWYAIGCR